MSEFGPPLQPATSGPLSLHDASDGKETSQVTEHLLNSHQTAQETRHHDNTTTFTWSRRIGLYGLAVLLGGTFAIIAAFSTLCFLWASNAGNSTWQKIMLRGWAARSVTITSLVVRLAVAAQATVCTAMIAALLLQRQGTQMSQVAAISMATTQNSAPHSLAWLMLRMRRRKRHIILVVAIASLTLTTVSSQLTSTVLLSGVRPSIVQDINSTVPLHYGYNESDDNINESTLYWSEKPVSYPAIAEYSETAEGAEGIYDTGLSMRGFLPLPSVSQRELLHSYQGRATVMDSRVVCVRPQMKDLTFHATNDGTGTEAPVVFGFVGTDQEDAGLFTWCNETCRTNFELPVEDLQPFQCSSAINGPDAVGNRNDPVVVCVVNSWTALWSSLIPEPDFGNLTAEQQYDQDLIDLGVAYLVIRTTGEAAAWTYLGNNADFADLELEDSLDSGEWLTYPVKSTLYTHVSLSFSLCFANFGTRDMIIQATQTSNSTEPDIGWTQGEEVANTTPVRRQLGVVSETLTTTERGIFQMQPQKNWSRYAASEVTLQGLLPAMTYAVTDLTNQYQANFSWVMCQSQVCNSGDYGETTAEVSYYQNLMVTDPTPVNYTFINPVYAAIFHDTVAETNHPALALQAHFTTLYRSVYYDILYNFDIVDNATVSFFVPIEVPEDIKVLLAVMAVLGLHLVWVTYVTWMFIGEGTLSLLGNVWSALAQMRSEEMDEWWREAENRTDSEVEKLMKEKGQHELIMRLEDDGTGRVQLRKQD